MKKKKTKKRLTIKTETEKIQVLPYPTYIIDPDRLYVVSRYGLSLLLHWREDTIHRVQLTFPYR